MNMPSIFRLAKNVSKISGNKHKLGAVLVKKGTPISVGCNQTKSNPHAPWVGLHAEVQCLKASGKDELKGSTIFVYRETKKGMPALAKPCQNCMNELREFGIKWVYYTTGEYPYFDVMKIQ